MVVTARSAQVAGFDVYDTLSALTVVLAGLPLLVRLLLRPSGERRLRGHQLDEALLMLTALSLAVLVLHQLVTDRLCHGSCSLTLSASSGSHR